MQTRLHTRLTGEPLSLDAAQAFVAAPGAGASVVFAGTVRDHSDGRPVAGLTYEAYEEVASARLTALASDILDRWPDLCAVYMEHRTGDLSVGEPAVVVAVSAGHREAAFEAARYGIDTLKASVPIWKQEHWADGGAHWPGTD